MCLVLLFVAASLLPYTLKPKPVARNKKSVRSIGGVSLCPLRRYASAVTLSLVGVQTIWV